MRLIAPFKKWHSPIEWAADLSRRHRYEKPLEGRQPFAAA
jgi:hypothetical protein